MTEERTFDEPQRVESTCEVRALGDRSLTFIASTERVARDGDIIEVAGWDTKEFMRNPVFLWAHDNHSPPIGRVTKTRKIRSKGEDRRLEIDVDFAGTDQNHDLAETVYRLYRDGFLNAVSVGFKVNGHRSPDDTEREKLGLGPFGHVITAAELLEVSAVPVPADPGAVLAKANPEDLVRMRNALTGEARKAWEPEKERDMSDSEPTIQDRIATEMGSLKAEILEAISTEFERVRDVMRLRSAPENPAEAEREEAPSVEDFGEALVRRLTERKE
jgi:HK97 family phage prohead protease